MIAYVFCHWKKANFPTEEYEKRQHEFHAALSAGPPAGFLGSFSVSFTGAPWVAAGGEAYEDWYLVENFGALESLNEGAVSGSRSAHHDAAAAVAEGGVGGIYALREGQALHSPRYAYWFGKPTGTSYKECFASLAPLVEQSGGALWMRQMTLGPAKEFCLHTSQSVSFPSRFDVLMIPLREVWTNK